MNNEIPKTYIQDKVQAEEVAHAEKLYRDTVFEYRKQRYGVDNKISMSSEVFSLDAEIVEYDEFMKIALALAKDHIVD